MSDATPGDAMGIAVKWAHQYATACQEALAACNACLEVANRAVGARSMADKRPQHEISIGHFTKMAEESEEEFIPLYRGFVEASDGARETATNFLSAQTDHDPDLVLASSVEAQVLDEAATMKAILSAEFGSTPRGFIDGIEQANAIMKDPFPESGIVYVRPIPTERACPWCAETIKTAAVICRFCGREVEASA